MKVFWGVIAAAAAITALIIAGTSVLMKDLDERHGNNTKKNAVETTVFVYDYPSPTEKTCTKLRTDNNLFLNPIMIMKYECLKID